MVGTLLSRIWKCVPCQIDEKGMTLSLRSSVLQILTLWYFGACCSACLVVCSWLLRRRLFSTLGNWDSRYTPEETLNLGPVRGGG